jgi:hypothetical protein
VRDCLDHLQPDPQRMRANLDAFLATVEGGEQFDLDRAVPAAAALVDRALRGRTAGSPGR